MLSKARFVLRKSKLMDKYDEMKKQADIVSYSYKTNPVISKVLEEDTKCMFSVHSIENLVQKDMKRVWFFAQAWNHKELKLLFQKGVLNFVVDNENDLNILLNYMKQQNKKINLLLRMRLKEHTIHTGKHFVFGFYSSKINRILPELRKNPNIEKLGIHFHRKTQNVSEWSLKQELTDSIKHWDKVDLVNIGGGIPAEYKNFRLEVIKNIFTKISELKSWLNNKKIKMIIEPGRYLAASPIKLETEITNIYENNIIINCSVFNAAMDTFVANIR